MKIFFKVAQPDANFDAAIFSSDVIKMTITFNSSDHGYYAPTEVTRGRYDLNLIKCNAERASTFVRPHAEYFTRDFP